MNIKYCSWILLKTISFPIFLVNMLKYRLVYKVPTENYEIQEIKKCSINQSMKLPPMLWGHVKTVYQREFLVVDRRMILHLYKFPNSSQ